MTYADLLELLAKIRQAENSRPVYPPALLAKRREAFVRQTHALARSASVAERKSGRSVNHPDGSKPISDTRKA